MKSSRNRVWLPDAESEASDKTQSAIPTMTQQNKDVYGLHLSFTTTEHTESYQGFRINRGVATSTDACSTLLDFISVMMLLVCGRGTAGHLGHSYCCYFTCHPADLYSAHMWHCSGLQPLPLWSQTDYGWCVLTNSVSWQLSDNFKLTFIFKVVTCGSKNHQAFKSGLIVAMLMFYIHVLSSQLRPVVTTTVCVSQSKQLTNTNINGGRMRAESCGEFGEGNAPLWLFAWAADTLDLQCGSGSVIRHVTQDLMHKLFSVVVFKDTFNLKTLIVLECKLCFWISGVDKKPHSGSTYSGKTQQSLPLLLISLLLLQALNFLQEAKLRTSIADLRVPRVLLLEDKFNTCCISLP